MPDFENNFSFLNGDVIYGDRDDRMKYKNKVKELYLERNASSSIHPDKAILGKLFDDLWITIDQYNNITFLPYDTRGDIAQTIAKDIKDPLTRDRASKYTNAFINHPNALQRDTLSDEQKKHLQKKEGNTSSDRDLFTLRIIRRSCKFGVLNLAEALGTSATIHFVLDSLIGTRMREIIEKVTYVSQDLMRGKTPAVPVTASELRALFRARNRLTTKVRFYRNFNEVVAPWVSEPDLWNKYAEARYEKYLKRVTDAFSFNAPAKAAVQGMVNRAALQAGALNFMEAADELRIAEKLGVPLSTPLPDEDDGF